MARGGKWTGKPLIEDSDSEDGGRVRAAAAAEETSDDDAEANADLSLLVAERAKLRRLGALNGSFRACTSGDLASSSSADTVNEVNGEVKGTKKKKKKKKQKLRKEDDGSRSAVMDLVGEGNAEAVEKLEAAVEAAEVVGPVDDKVAEVRDSLELRKLLRGPRYFDPPSSEWTACYNCYNCGEAGHMAVNCTAEKKRKPCFVCGSLDHHGFQCAKGLECFICKKAGHRAKDCSDKLRSYTEDLKLCLKCGECGHDMFSCGNDYHPDDLKEIQCYVCKKFGHLCCVNYMNNNKTVISCFRCGEWGHDGLACTRSQENNTNSRQLSAYDSLFRRKSAHNSLFETKSAHSANPQATKAAKKAAKAKKKLDELKVSGLRPRKSKKKSSSSPKTAPPAIGKISKKKQSKIDKGTNSTPQKSRGGWITEDPGDTVRSKTKKNNWDSPSTPSSKPYKYHSGAQSFQGLESGYEQQYSASRFGYSNGTHYNPSQRTPSSYGDQARTYGHFGSDNGLRNTYGHSSRYDHRNTYGNSDSRYGHHNTHGHSGSMYSDHNTNSHSGGSYGHPSSSKNNYDPARTYGSHQAYGHHGNTRGNSGGGYDKGKGLFGDDSSSRPRWNHGR